MFHLYSTSQRQLPEIARCHMASFPESFGTKLGYAYTVRSLEWFLAGHNRFLFHIEKDGKAVGYCGGFQPAGAGDGSTSGMMQYAMKEAAIGMFKKPWLFFHKDVVRFYPLIVKNIWKKVTVTKKKPVPNTVVSNTHAHIGLVVIGVHPAHRGTGCFELLMKNFENECIKRNAAKMILSVKASNSRAIAAYKKAGWHISLETENVLEMYKPLSA